MSATDKALYKGMIDAGWNRQQANEFIKAVLENGGTASAEIDTENVRATCKNGKRVFF